MMKINVSVGNWAKRYIKSDSLELNLPEKSTVADVLKMLPLPPDETGLAAIGGKAAKRDSLLSEGDCVKIYPSIAAG
ncbi:MAG: hypothetical protein FWD23_05835 [Oscillospiraceae bacterium]|nr:hypothetical protein [Oscillospiraceae bacterium]